MKTANAGENWVYLDGQIAKGSQPHSVLIHEVGKHLTGEAALGQVANTWLAENELPKGLNTPGDPNRHGIARGHYDKRGRPAIWESNTDRNAVMDAAYAALQQKAAAVTSEEEWEGEPGNLQHITFKQQGTVPTALVANMPGGSGEMPGEHRNRKGQFWQGFLDDIRENGIQEPLFIFVDPGQAPVLAEGNHRRDAAVELGLPEVPVEIRYFGHAERTQKIAAYNFRETTEEMYAKIQGLGWDVLSQGPKNDLYSVTIRDVDGAQIERTGKTPEQAMASALTWAWQHSHMSKTATAGRYIITNSFDSLVSDKASSAGEAMDWAEEMANMGEPGDNFQVYDMVEKKPIAAFYTDEADRHKNFEEHTSAHIKDEMDLPIPTQTLGQVMSMLRPNPLDGNHLGLQAHKLGYSMGELQTLLRLEEAEGVQPGWKGFKEAALSAYASRGWKTRTASMELRLFSGGREDGQTGGMQKIEVPDAKEGKRIAYQAMSDAARNIYRAQIWDPLAERDVWDTDKEWRQPPKEEEEEQVPQAKGQGFQQLNLMGTDWVTSSTDWTVTSNEQTPDYMFVYYQGVLEVDDYSPNTHSFDMLKRILDLAGKDVTDQNVDDNKMSSGEITKRDGEIDVELTNLADLDVQEAALNSVQQWAEGMNLIGPIQVPTDG